MPTGNFGEHAFENGDCALVGRGRDRETKENAKGKLVTAQVKVSRNACT
jgi:hypothetical protein